MANLEICLSLLNLCGLVIGCVSIGLARGHRQIGRALWGRRLFVLTLLFLGGCGLFGAVMQASNLPLLGLAVVFLLVLMLWETPEPLLES